MGWKILALCIQYFVIYTCIHILYIWIGMWILNHNVSYLLWIIIKKFESHWLKQVEYGTHGLNVPTHKHVLIGLMEKASRKKLKFQHWTTYKNNFDEKHIFQVLGKDSKLDCRVWLIIYLFMSWKNVCYEYIVRSRGNRHKTCVCELKEKK
jgi:hypothetical protein